MKHLRIIILLAITTVSLLSCKKEIEFEDSRYHPIRPEELPDIPTVEIKDGKFYVNGEEFFVKGAALNGDNKDSDRQQEFWKEAVSAGANMVRIYGASGQAREMLDEIAKKGMYVCFGLNMGRQCNDFDYNDDFARKKQLASIKSIVDDIKDHPAILMWCIGNELEGEVDNVNKNVWDDVNEISKYIHANDTRPTTIAICWPFGIMPDIIRQVPDIDFLCVNQYIPEIYDVHNSVISSGFTKPYIISEFGPRGTWNKTVPSTEWGGLIEETGTQKAEEYRKVYNECVLAHKDEGCIGSFAFLWGYQSHGDVLTWYAMFDQFQKYPLPAVDVMSELWTGLSVENHAPTIENTDDLTINGLTADMNIKLKGGDEASASVVASDIEADQLTYDWKIVKDERQEAGKIMQQMSGLIQGKPSETVTFKAPATTGNYRLIVYVRDVEHKKADMAAFPFRVTESGDEPEPEDLLKQHDTDEIWFAQDSNSGGYFNLGNGERYTYGSSFNQGDVDMVAFRGTGRTAMTFAAPTDTDLQAWIDNSIKWWTVQNNTHFKKITVDFDAITTESEIAAAYEDAPGDGGIRFVLALGETGIIKTVDDHYALVKLIGGSKDGDTWTSFQISMKTIE